MQNIEPQEQDDGEIEKLRAALMESERLASIGHLAAGVAHEINNPVGYVQSNLQTLTEYVADIIRLIEAYEEVLEIVPDGPQRAKIAALREQVDVEFLLTDLTDLVQESAQGVGIVKDIALSLRDFSRQPGGQMTSEDMNQLADRTIRIAQNEIKYSATIDKDLAATRAVMCNPSMIAQVVLNLLINAGHAIEANGKITVRTRDSEDGVTVEVEDNGSGIAPEQVEKIFQPFFTTKPAGKGTGLGLAMAAEIIERHGGKIQVKSEQGAGTCFTIWLPVEGAAEQPATAGGAN